MEPNFYVSDSVVGFAATDPSLADNKFSETAKFINQILFEENVDHRPCYDSLTLQITEKSFYDALTGNQPLSLNQHPLLHSSEAETTSTTTSNSSNNSINKENSRELRLPFQDSVSVADGLSDLDSSIATQNIFNDAADSIMQFLRGLEEATKYLPPKYLPPGPNLVTAQQSKREKSINKFGENSYVLKGRKNLEYQGIDTKEEEERRSNKQSALSLVDERDFSDAFDRVLLLSVENVSIEHSYLQSEAGGGKGRSEKKETVDLKNVLLMCAQSVYANDNRTANELLKQIRQHSSPFGDASQRLAHYFANGLEARMVGDVTCAQGIYSFLTSKGITSSDYLKAHQVLLSAYPFKKFAYFFAGKMIMKAAAKAQTVHVIDFGILFGFQWPMLIKLLSNREGGPPKLRITGIEYPLPGFRPTARIKETGRHLANYCRRYNVPFEFNAIVSRNWETIQVEDIKIHSNELVAVNTLFRFENLLDETFELNSPRNAVLHLVKKINPDIFTQSIFNGSYSAPYFSSRFREVLFHYSAGYDVCDTVMPRENEWRKMLEREILGREIMNVIACEGAERVSRPETYKQWQARNTKAGFKQLPLNEELMAIFRTQLKKWYHKDFVLDEDNNWMLQGWKGRILFASTCWVPA